MDDIEDSFIIDNKLFNSNILDNTYVHPIIVDLPLGELYLLTSIYNDYNYCNIVLLEAREEKFDIVNDNEILKAYSGFCYSPANECYNSYELYDYDIIGNYTQYLIRRNAATKIQNFWRKYKAVIIIKKAWKNWKNKMELANPFCFVGLTYNLLQFIRLNKID